MSHPPFISELENTNVFITSHHGRISGYHEDVFEHCKPEIVVISDQERSFSTQEHDQYSKHATGVNMGTILVPNIRKVLTTRNDGHLSMKNINGVTYVTKGL